MTTFIIAVMLVFTLLCLIPLLSYPLLLLIRSAKIEKKSNANAPSNKLPKITLLCVVCNGENLISKKVDNCLSLDYPKELLEIVFASDGSTDATNEVLAKNAKEYSQLKFYFFTEHNGKNATLNKVLKHCDTDIVVFSDADAQIAPDAIRKLIRHFDTPDIGGVCGQRVIQNKDGNLGNSQAAYIDFDSWIKKLESRSGSISSNDGKLYAVRKSLLKNLPLSVTDDLFNCLTIIGQKYRFVFEPLACAYIVKPVKNARHELSRRRRITARSLTGIALNRSLLNPKNYGFFAISLFINKVIRRSLSVLLLVWFLGALVLAPFDLLFLLFFLLQSAIYSLAFVFLSQQKYKVVPQSYLEKTNELIAYVTIGNIGCLLGIADFLTGKEYSQWIPLKETNS
jgi:cellulose synthase/poly-beta-1,6-N-acetylglucosamine synthase-like glycosyltransferase